MTRIGVSGSGGSGKTTLARALSETLGVPLVGEFAADWLQTERKALPWMLDVDDQLRLQRYVISRKVREERPLPAFVSDRTTVDAVVLLQLRLERAGASMPGELVAEALEHARTTYDVALVLGPDRPGGGADAVSELDKTLREREVALTSSRYGEVGVAAIRVPPLQPDEALGFAVASLAPYLCRTGRRP